MGHAMDSSPRYVIYTRSGARGPFTRERILDLIASGRIPPGLRIQDAKTSAVIPASDLMEDAPAVAAISAVQPAAEQVQAVATAASSRRPPMPAAARQERRSRPTPKVRRRLIMASIAVLLLIPLMGMLLHEHVNNLLAGASGKHAAGPAAVAAERASTDLDAAKSAFSLQVAPFLTRNCIACHGSEQQKGEVRFDQASADPADAASVDLWKRAQEQLEDGTMPPRSRPRPEPAQQAVVAAWMQAQIRRHAQIWPDPPLRLFNRQEYANALVDLLGLRQDLSSLLPDELNGSEGFTNEAESLQVTTQTLSAYLKAAQYAASVVVSPSPVAHWTMRTETADPLTCDPNHKVNWDQVPRIMNAPDQSYNAICRGGTLVFYDPGTASIGRGLTFDLLPVRITVAGAYRIRFKACAIRGLRPAVRVRITYTDIDGMPDWSQAMSLGLRPFIECDAPSSLADEHAAAAALAAVPPGLTLDHLQDVDPMLGMMYANAASAMPGVSPKSIEKWLMNSRPVPKPVYDQVAAGLQPIECIGQLPVGDIKLTFNGENLQPDRWLFVGDTVEIEGPLPVAHDDAKLSAAISRQDLGSYARWLSSIMSQAYRREVPVKEAVARFQRFKQAGNGGVRSFADSARVALASVLVSPEFCTLPEAPRADARLPRRLTGSELTTRLALFLWRGLPDLALMQQLTTSANPKAELAAQAVRMLRDERSRRFIHEFNDGWLGLGGFDTLSLDPKLFPLAQGAHLRASLRREPDEFLAHLIESDGSILDILDCDYVVINDRLGEYYRIVHPPFPEDDSFHVVKAPPRSDAHFEPWWYVGPFTAPSADLANQTAFDPEKGVDLTASYRNGTLHWTQKPEWVDGGGYGFPPAVDNAAYYLVRTVTSGFEQDVVLSIGSDDGFHLFLDGRLMAANNVWRGVEADEDFVTIHLSPGKHQLMLKVNNGAGNTGFYFRMVDQVFNRGGVLGMGAILMQTSNSTRTSPVRRGVWFLENLLGTRPPPPPPKAKDQLARIEAGLQPKSSRRQVLEAHRSNPICASCHARFDPLGFALEDYEA